MLYLAMENNITIPQLDSEEQRVLGALIEKSRATPEYYPMTVNALIGACNQKTARNPVVSYDEEMISQAINSLRKKGLMGTVTGAGSRAVKYKHTLAVAFPLVPAELAVICLLLLRGPLTPGEINSNSARLYAFESLEEVQEVLDKLLQNEPAFIRQVPRKPGQKEQRFIHCLGESAAETQEKAPQLNPDTSVLEERVQELEEEVRALKFNLTKLMNDLGIEVL